MADGTIRRIVKLVFDRASGRKTEQDAKKSLSGLEKGLATLKKAALSLGAALGAAFAVRKVIQFGKEVIRVANEAEAIWNRLGQAVENVGLNFEEVRPEIDAFARAMQDATVVGDEQFAEILTELITTSNDYAASINAVGTVADLAAAKQLDLRTAAQLVGRALIGETGTFKRYGIIVREGETAMDALRRQFRGFAENEAKTVQGRLAQLNNEWGDLKQFIGEVLTSGADAESFFGRLVVVMKHLNTWLIENRDLFEDMASIFRDLVFSLTNVLSYFAKLERILLTIAELQMRIRRTGVGGVFFSRKELEEDQKRLETFRRFVEELEVLAARLRSGERSAIELPPPYIPEGKGRGPPAAGGGAVQLEIPHPIGLEMREDLEMWQKLGPQWGKWLELSQNLEQHAELMRAGWARLNSEMEMSPANAEKLAQAVEEVGDAAVMSQQEMMILAQVTDVAGSLISGIFSGDIGRVAAWKAKQNAIMAAEQLAQAAAISWIPGLQGNAADHLAAAAQFSAVSAAWATLAGATGGFGGRGHGGAGASRDIGGAAAARAQTPGPEVHIYFDGPGFDAVNPRVQRVIAGAVRNYEQRYGTANVVTHRRKGG